MKKCVIFDMDGVIIDSEPIHQKCERRMFQMLGINVSESEHNAFMGTTDETWWSWLGSKYKLPIKIDEVIQLKKILYLEHLKQDTYIKPIPFVSELIADLYKDNFSLALASSSPHEQIDYILSSFELKYFFKIIISGEDVKEGKPSPEIFLKASELLGIPPESCIVIEDSYNGVMAAKSANMKCIGFNNPNSGNQDLGKADQIINSFKEISAETIIDLV